MMRRILNAPIRNTARAWRPLATLLLVMLPSACGGTRGSTDTRTNWLSSCTGDQACDVGLSCVCGVCTQPCGSGQSCGDVNAEAVCVDAPGCGEASQVCAKEGFFEVVEDSSVTGSEVTAAPESSAVDGSDSLLGTTGAETAGSSATSEGEAGSDASATTDGDGSTGGVDASACDDPGRQYTSRDPEECTELPNCGVIAEGVGLVAFSDECGCGCEPYVAPPRADSITAGECAASPPSGSSANFAVLAESELGQFSCTDVPSALLRSESDVTAWSNTTGCPEIAGLAAGVDFDTQTVIVVGVPDRPTVSVTYTEQLIDGVIHVGIAADAYCGGARPPSGFALVTVDVGPSVPLQVVTETCLAECPDDGGLPVP